MGDTLCPINPQYPHYTEAYHGHDDERTEVLRDEECQNRQYYGQNQQNSDHFEPFLDLLPLIRLSFRVPLLGLPPTVTTPLLGILT